MKKMNIAEARKKMTRLEEEFSDDEKVISVTKYNKPVLAVLPWDFYEALMETLEIITDQEMMKQLKLSFEQIKSGKTINWNKAKKEMVFEKI